MTLRYFRRFQYLLRSADIFRQNAGLTLTSVLLNVYDADTVSFTLAFLIISPSDLTDISITSKAALPIYSNFTQSIRVSCVYCGVMKENKIETAI